MMDKDTPPERERKQEQHAETDDTGEDDGSWLDKYPSETIEAVPPNDVTAGVHITRYDMSEVDHPTIYELHQHYPPEDGQDGESVWLYGTRALQHTIATLATLSGDGFDADPWPEEP